MCENQQIDHQNILRILPQDVLYYNRYGSYAGIVMVHQPCIKELQVQGNAKKPVKCKYHFPYLVVLLNSNKDLKLYFAYEQPGNKTVLYQPMLPNFGGSATMCYGNIKKPEFTDLHFDQLQKAVWACVFGGVFTNHSNENAYQEMLKGIVTKWSKQSKELTVMGKLKEVVNMDIMEGKLDLFRTW